MSASWRSWPVSVCGVNAVSDASGSSARRSAASSPHTLTGHDRLDADITTALARGYATEVEELALGRACVAAPVRDRDNAVVAAVSVSGPLSAIDLGSRRDELGRAVLELADTISTALGYRAVALPAEALAAIPDDPG